MRHPDWVARLRDAIASQQDKPFAWGERDCCLAAGDVAAALGDFDPMRPFRPTDKGPRYKSARGAIGMMRKYLGDSWQDLPQDQLLEHVCAKRGGECHFPEIEVKRAQRGDLVLARALTDAGEADVLAVVDMSGRQLITAYYQTGWLVLPIIGAGRRAWRV